MDQIDQSRHILLVEDEAIIALAEKSTIEGHGYRVTVAGSGERAVELMAEKGPFDLVLMDIDLGSGIPGTEAARRILEEWTLPIVFLTSHSEREVVEAVKGITRYGYVLKSAGQFVLLEAITMAFELFQANSVAEEKSDEIDDFFDLSIDLLAIADLEGRFRRVNPAWEELLGYTRSQIEGAEFLQFVHPEDVEETIEAMQGLSEGRRAEGFVNRYRRADGSYRFIEWRSRARGELIYAVARDVTDRVHREERLSRESSLFRQLFQEHPTPRLLIHPTDGGRIVDANRAAADFYGYDRETLCAMSIYGLNSANRPEVSAALRQAASGAASRFDFKHRRADGSIRDVLVATSPVTLDDEVVLYSVIQDVTARRRAQAEASRQRRLLQGVVEHASLGIAITDEEGRVVEWNRALEEITGISRSRVLGLPAWEAQLLIADGNAPDESGRTRMRRVFESMLHGDGLSEPLEREVEIETPRGRRNLYQSIFRVEGEGGSCLASITHDLTPLIERERQYRLLAENSHDAIMLLDQELQTRYVSPSIAEITGYRADWFDRRSPLELVLNEDLEGLADLIDATIVERKRSESARVRLRRADGDLVWVEARGSFEYAQGGELSSILVNLREISAQIAAEEALEQRNAYVEFLIREVQHRIKNIMSTMVSLLALQSRTVGQEAREALQSAANRFRSMANLYDRLYRNIETGVLEVGESLAPLVRETVDQFPAAPAISVEVDCDVVLLDARSLSSLGILVTELVNNSMKYAFAGREGGTIRFEVRALDDGGLRLVVADDGCGIPDPLAAQEQKGFGMELVRFLSEGLGATVHLEGSQGARFAIELPPTAVSSKALQVQG